MLSKKYWLLANFLGWTIGVMVIIGLSGILDQFGLEGFQFYVGLGMGLAIATTHALYLEADFKSKTGFILKGGFGMSIPFLIGDIIFPQANGIKLMICVLLGAILFSVFTFSKKTGNNSLARHLLTYTLAWIIASAPIFLISLTMQIHTGNMGKLLIAFLNLGLILFGGIIMGLTTKRMQK
jgi:hypothetical protein